MTYAYDLTRLVVNLCAAAESARTLFTYHTYELEPWMFHQFERAREECAALAARLADNCKEVVK